MDPTGLGNTPAGPSHEEDAMDPYATITTRRTPQTEQAAPEQIPNAAGGYGFKLGDDARVHRFLTLGTDGGTYYATEQELTKANADVILRAARERGTWLVEQIVAISTAGRAPRQNPALFALAAACGLADDTGRKAALDAIPAVCRTGTHLFLFARYVEQFRGWGRGLRRAIGGWYSDRDVNDVAYQAVKYRQREGWTHRDLLRLAHPDATTPQHKGLYEWIARATVGDDLPDLVRAFIRAQEATTVGEWTALIAEHPLSWEMLPDTALTEPTVWRALVGKGMPQTALMRQLPRLTRLGVLTGATRDIVTAQLADTDRLRKGRVHPVNVLVAMRTYAFGTSMRGTGTWEPVRQVVDALDAAFYAAFGTVEAAGKRTCLALDVSGSMSWAPISGLPITPREASAALALVTMASEPETDVVAFTSGRGGLSRLSLSPRQRLDDAIRSVSNLPFGGTDCASPIVWATETGQQFDTFQVHTDNETWAGSIHPHEALVRYRQKTGIDARLAVVGMTANDVSIADPKDPGMLDVAGFDSATPNLIADFSRGTI
jgi:60 kDa SS-A/Ro ribonucleoprotein